ncbi:unnamed protein product [Vicia faba]|uniref:Uncharacterized protein n=1 Tax=Vicia faba TaxID=3906 RepID=A0AAV1ASS7_VICFA|nr:unnamed protein product [Vicia faba]
MHFLKEGGFGLISLWKNNEAASLKMTCATLFGVRSLMTHETIAYSIDSSISCGLNMRMVQVKGNSILQIYKSGKVNFVCDYWNEDFLVDKLHIQLTHHHHLTTKVSDFIQNDRWIVPHYQASIAGITHILHDVIALSI